MRSLFRRVTALVLLALIGAAIGFRTAQASTLVCGDDHERILRVYAKNTQQTVRSTATDRHGNTVTTIVGPDGKWTHLVMFPHLQKTCIVMTGDNFKEAAR